MSASMPPPTNRRQEDELEPGLETGATETKVLDTKPRRYHIDERDDYIRERIRS
jgi:hypothetical protein